MLIQSLKEKLQEGKWDNFKSQMKELFQLITEGWGGHGGQGEGISKAIKRPLQWGGLERNKLLEELTKTIKSP